jgi:GT2 family glycosyltransferase
VTARQAVGRLRTLATAALRRLRQDGLRATVRHARLATSPPPHLHRDYQAWLRRYESLAAEERQRLEAMVLGESDPPLISIVVPTFNSDPAQLRRAVASVRDQIYPRWELCLVDDRSTDGTARVARELASLDDRITFSERTTNGGIAEATNTALATATGDYVAFLDHDDELAAAALLFVAASITQDPGLDVLYSDEDKIDAAGERYEPYFKPDFNPELLLAQNYFNHLTVVRRALLTQLEGLRTDLDGAQDHDLVLRAVEATTPDRIAHIPRVLYHWRHGPRPTNFARRYARRTEGNSLRVVQEHLDRVGEGATATAEPRTPGWPETAAWARVTWPVPEPAPWVTAIVPTRDGLPLLRTCLRGLLEETDYPHLRVLVVDNGSTDPDTLQFLDQLRAGDRTDVLAAPGPFNYAALNNAAVRATSTPLLLLLNNDVEVVHPNWLAEMVALASRDGVGAVGAKLLYSDATVQHAGVVLGIGDVAGHAMKYRPAGDTGYFGRLVLTQEVSAVTGACLLTHANLWHAVGGLDEEHLAVAFNDVDYCLRIRAARRRVVWAANAELRHLESRTRGPEDGARRARYEREAAWMQRRWAWELRHDPFYNPNLSVEREDHGLAYPPRVGEGATTRSSPP